MDDNLQSQYEQLILYLEQYWSFAKRFNVWFVARRLKFSYKSLIAVEKRHPQSKRHPLIDKIGEGSKDLLSELATDEDKKNEFFSILLSDYRMDALCAHLVTHFPGFDFGKLKKVHELQKAQFTRLNRVQIFGTLFAISTILLNTVPQSVVEHYYKPYSDFEFIVFWITVLFEGYLLLIFGPIWVWDNMAKRIHTKVGDVLGYLEIKQGEKSG